MMAPTHGFPAHNKDVRCIDLQRLDESRLLVLSGSYGSLSSEVKLLLLSGEVPCLHNREGEAQNQQVECLGNFPHPEWVFSVLFLDGFKGIQSKGVFEMTPCVLQGVSSPSFTPTCKLSLLLLEQPKPTK